ncbi:matrin-3-like isoform X2 [Dunckerocampus dactyliophorus]|uniref:matrin-3-like isoform X2 n=1 Tax=Dunckerocampus dactyliophorus TaxID=161453 RepID=UPI0024054576|nr:matrin-3-like isoform X2 [Dunckerocampus dactyliophorus]
MSRNQRHQPPLSNADLWPSLGSTSFSDCRRPSPDHDLYRSRSESGMLPLSSSYHLSSSSRSSPSFSAHSILSSCGLESDDLSLLAELPEDALTVESLPQLLHQIKSDRSTFQPPPASWSHLPSSANQPTNWRDWQDPRWSPRTYGSVFHRDSPPPSSSYYDMDTWPAYSGEDAQPGRPAKNIPSLFSLPGPANRFFVPPMEPQLRTGWEQGLPDAYYNEPTRCTMPCKREAQDFHGTAPGTYPYSCSLCNVTVLSEKNWNKHINNPHHAARQLGLLQRFPMWDCRLETVNSAGKQSEKKREDHSKSRAVKTVAKKAANRSNVVCVKFPAQSVDESYLRKLAEPFGKITNILVFASLAFLEMGSADQAKELVKSHSQSPPNVNGQQIGFSISNSFNFVKNCRVLHFTPPPEGDDDRSDLLSVVKRFGQPFYTLFLPCGAFIEMKSLKDAQKLVDYYSSNTLKINDKVLQVSFSAEYSSLTKASSAQRYEEESNKRTRSRHEDILANESRKRRKEEHRSKSRERKARSRSKSKERKARSKSREEKAKSQFQERSSSSISKMTEEEKPEKPESSSASAAALLKPSEDGHDKDQSILDDFSEEESDIEGMEVMGEDGEDLEADDMETLEEAEEEMEKEQEADMEDHWPGPEGEKREEGDCEADGGKCDEERHSNSKEPKDEEAEVPVSTGECITVEKPVVHAAYDHNTGEDDDDDDPQQVSRVVFFNNLPLRYCNAKSFINLSKGLGRQVRYILLHGQMKGFIEMSNTAEAVRVANELNFFFKNTQTVVLISNKYRRLTKGCRIHDPDQPRSGSSRQSDQHKDSRTKDQEESQHRRKSSRSCQEEEREKSIRKAHEKQSASRNTSESESKSGKSQQIKSEKQSSGRKGQENSSAGEKTLKTESEEGKFQKIEPRKTADALQKCGEMPEREGVSSKASEDINAIPQTEITDSKQDRSREDGFCETRKAPPEIDSVPQKTSQTSGESSEKHGQNPSEAQSAALADKSHQEAADGPPSAPPPLQPVGTEFVRPVVGYFCNLCQLIYVDEDEAKVQHCSSRQHHDKYQEKMKTVS